MVKYLSYIGLFNTLDFNGIWPCPESRHLTCFSCCLFRLGWIPCPGFSGQRQINQSVFPSLPRALRILYIGTAKCRCLVLAQRTKYGHHIRSVKMTDDRGSWPIVANNHDFTNTVNLYSMCYYHLGHRPFFNIVLVAFLMHYSLHKRYLFNPK